MQNENVGSLFKNYDEFQDGYNRALVQLHSMHSLEANLGRRYQGRSRIKTLRSYLYAVYSMVRKKSLKHIDQLGISLKAIR